MNGFNSSQSSSFDCAILISQSKLELDEFLIGNLLQLDDGNFNTTLDTDERKLAYSAIENELNRYQVNKDIVKNLKVELVCDALKGRNLKEWIVTYTHNKPMDIIALFSIASLSNYTSMRVKEKCRLTGLTRHFSFEHYKCSYY